MMRTLVWDLPGSSGGSQALVFINRNGRASLAVRARYGVWGPAEGPTYDSNWERPIIDPMQASLFDEEVV